MSTNDKSVQNDAAAVTVDSPPPSSTPPLELSNSAIPAWIGIGSVMLAASVAVGVKYGNRMAEKMETDNPPKRQIATRNKPIVTEAQRRAATNKAFLALGLGTVVCAAWGYGITVGFKRYYEVDNMVDFAKAFGKSVERFNAKHLNPIVSFLYTFQSNNQTIPHFVTDDQPNYFAELSHVRCG